MDFQHNVEYYYLVYLISMQIIEKKKYDKVPFLLNIHTSW